MPRTTRPAPKPPTSPDELHGGKDGELWQHALQLAGGDRHRIELLTPTTVRVVNPTE